MSDTARRVETGLESFFTGLPVGAVAPAPPTVKPVDSTLLRLVLGPLALMTTTPFLMIALWLTASDHGGSFLDFFSAGPSAWLAELPRPTWNALGIALGWTLVQGILLTYLPGERFLGPPTPAGEQPVYKLNGMAAWWISHLGVAAAWWGGLFSAASFYDHYGSLLVTMNLGALAFCAFLYWKGTHYPSSRDSVLTGSLIFDFFQGPELHPRLGGMNLKQLINCRVSMMGWSVIACLFAAAQYEKHGVLSTSMIASVAVLVVYLYKFFWWESGYFTSLDIMHDRFGYYICWGVLAWVPSAYETPFMYLVDHPIQRPWPVAIGVIALGVLSIWINYDADAQRQRVRATNGNTTVWGKPPETMVAPYTTSDGQKRTSILLLSGWWGVARHFHYVPELGLAFAWTVSAGFSDFLPWFYWVFLSILLFDRAGRDEKRCAAKYGDSWADYRRRVPYRIVPFLY